MTVPSRICATSAEKPSIHPRPISRGQLFRMHFHGSVIIRMAYHHSFGFPGGSGCVYERGWVVRESGFTAARHKALYVFRRFHAEPHEVIPQNAYLVVRSKSKPEFLNTTILATLSGFLSSNCMQAGIDACRLRRLCVFRRWTR